MTILLIEDDEVLAPAIVDTLTEAGYGMIWAKSGEDGLMMVEKQPVDLILLDILLPGIDGYEVLRRLKADPKTQKVKVVMLTNLGQMSEINRALDLGASDYVIKANIDVAQLPEMIKTKFLTL